MKRRGFTLIELLVVVAIIALLIAILLPSLGKARELANRGTCAANVRGIAQSMHVYGADNNDVYPCVPAPSNNSTPTYKLAANTTAVGGTSTDLTYNAIYQQNSGQSNAGSPMACLWILCIRGDVAPKQFICKSDPVGAAASPLLATGNIYNTNFNDASGTAALADNHYSYSISYPWTPAAAASPGGWWKATSDSSIPILADMSPKNGTPTGNPTPTNATNSFQNTTKYANTIHHSRDGQNISYGDAHADFQRSPFVGQGGDNIYTVGPSGPSYPSQNGNVITSSGNLPAGWTAGSAGSYDTIMVPCSDAGTNVRF